MKKFKWLIALPVAVMVIAITTYVFALAKGDMRVGDVVSNESVNVTATNGDVTVVKTVSKTSEEGKFHVSFNVSGGESELEGQKPLYAVVVFDNSGSMICDASKKSVAYSLSDAQDLRRDINDYFRSNYELTDLFDSYTAEKGDNETIYCSKHRLVERLWDYDLEFISGDVVLSNKWENAVDGASSFVNEILGINGSKVSFVTFSATANTATDWYESASAVPSSIYAHAIGGTNLYAALTEANSKLSSVNDSNSEKVVVVISDGEPTLPTRVNNSNYPVSQATSAATTIKNAGVKIFTIGYDVEDNEKAQTVLTNVSSTSANDETQYAFSAGVDNVENVFNDLASYVTNLYATDVTLKDNLGAKFSFSDGTEGKEYEYNIAKLTNNGETFGFDINIDPDSADGWYNTNNGFTLEYTDANGESKTISSKALGLPDPEVYWVGNRYPYTINYYKDSVSQDNFLNDISSEDVKGAVITADTTKFLPDYYKFEGTAPTMTISNTGENVLNVVYVKDESKTQVVKYTVHHFIEGSLQNNDDFTENTTVWAGEVNPQIDVTYEINENKYTGYKLDTENTDEIPAKANNNDEFNVYYIKDETQTKKLSYKVEYYKDNVKVDADSYTVTKNVWVNDNTLPVDSVDTSANKYVGYSFDHTEPSTIPENIAGDGVIKVFYVKDNNQTKQLNYIIRHYKEAAHIEADDYARSKTVWVNDPDTIEVDYIVNPDKYVGYKLDTENSSTIPTVANSGSEFNLYYVKDETQTKKLSYTVEYYIDNEKQDNDSYTVTKDVWVNDTTLAVDEIDTANDKYVGYKFDTTDPEEIPTDVEDGTVIKVYYVKDETQTKELSYTVEYYIDNEKQDNDSYTVTKDVWVNDTTLAVDEIDTANDKYVGYKFDTTDPEEIPTAVEDGTVIKVFYVKDETQTKELSYTVKHFKDNVPVENDDYISTRTVWINDPDTIEVDYKLDENKYTGYVIDNEKTDEISSEVENGTVLNVYYKKGNYEYVINYYYDNVLDSSKTEKLTALFEDVIENYPDKKGEDYKLEKVENLPLVISTENNEINVYYVTDGIGAVVPEPPHTSVNNYTYLMTVLVNILAVSLLLKKEEN